MRPPGSFVVEMSWYALVVRPNVVSRARRCSRSWQGYNGRGGHSMLRIPCLILVAAAASSAADKKPPAGQSSNDQIEITATVYNDKEEIRKLVGSDLGGSIVVVDVRVAPKGDQEVAISRDDFLLRSEKDGQRAGAFAPSQIAGSGALVVSQTGRAGPGFGAENNGPIWGGIGGGRPQRLPGQGATVGSAGGETSAQATAQDDPKAKDNPLLATLKQRELPQKKTSEPLSGLLADEGICLAAQLALAEIGAPAVPAMEQALQSHSSRVRHRAANVLGGIGERRSVAPLLGLLQDSDEDVRVAAIQALGRIGDPRAIEALTAKCSDQDWMTRDAAKDALRLIREKESGGPPRRPE